MLNVEIAMKRLAFGKIHERWFYDAPEGSGSTQLVTYYHCKNTAPVSGFARKQKFTFLINLSDSEDAIADRFVKNTRYEVRRAAKDGVTTASGATQEEFRQFFDGFAE